MRHRQHVCGEFGQFPGFDVIHAAGLIDMQGAALQASQFLQMRSAAQCTSQISGESSDIGTFGTAHNKISFGLIEADILQIKRIDMDRPWRSFNGFSLPGQFIQRLASHFQRGNHRRNLGLRADEFRSGLPDVFFAEAARIRVCYDVAGSVFGIGFNAETDGAGLGFILSHQLILQLGCFAQPQHEQSGGKGVESSAVAGFIEVVTAPDAVDHIMTGPVLGFVN